MELKFVAFILSVLAASVMCMSAQDPTKANLPVVKTNFDEHAQLSPEEVQEVIQLAQKCGIRKVASIYTYNIHPSPCYGIGVNGQEEVTGRQVRYDNLQVTHSSWNGTNWHPGPQALNVGKFWAEQHSRHACEYTTFQVTNKTLRVRLYKGLSIQAVDELLAAIAAGNIRFADEKVHKAWKSVDLATLAELAGDGGQYRFYFTVGQFEIVCFYCEFKNGQILVKATHTMIS